MNRSSSRPSRRNFLASAAAAQLLANAGPAAAQELSQEKPTMTLDDYQPKSMLVVPEHPVPRARYPVIDVHTHISGFFGGKRAPDPVTPSPTWQHLDEIAGWMDNLNLKMLVNLTGGSGDDLVHNAAALAKKYGRRYVTCVEPAWTRIEEPDYPAWQADHIVRAKKAGAVGVKVTKTLGLYLRAHGREGPLVKVDDPRFDPMWDQAGKLKLPVFMHIGDPDAFFTPIDRYNERWEELGHHPNWSFYGKDFPPKADLLARRNRVVERHPNTTFVGLHVANHPENLAEVSGWLRKYPNLNVEIGARLGELGRQPRQARKFFDEFQDRIMFGTDASPNESTPQQILKPAMYQLYFRWLETLDEYFDYAPSPTPPQGRWRVYGIGLPDTILKKVYHNNAAKILKLSAI